MLVKAGHIQGAACSEKAIYLSHMLGIVKLDWNGKLLKTMDAPSHLGDIEYANGKIYGAFCVRNAKLCPKGMNGLVRVWDEDLNLLAEKWFPELFDGIAVLGDTVYVGVDRWGRKSHPLCCVKRLGLDLSDRVMLMVILGFRLNMVSRQWLPTVRICFSGAMEVRPKSVPTLSGQKKWSFPAPKV
jgi:hypothetical protein